ncbi:MAG: cytochrome c oxidase assembly protein, partial [Candidatus Limnocylindrales bacterium]
VPWLAAAIASIAYLVAVRKVNGPAPRIPIPAWRTLVWLLGVATILLALSSSIDLYAGSFLTVHMGQHLLLAMVAPPLLALGAPVTLLLRASGADLRKKVLLPALHSRFVRVIASPFVAWPVFAGTMFATHFSPLYDAALGNAAIHDVEHVVFLVTGVLFWWPVIAADPIPQRLGYGGRFAYVVLQMPVNAAVGLVIYFAPTVLYRHYATITRTWGPPAITDQQIGGLVMWGAGDLIFLLVVPLIVAAWMRADVRRSARRDAVLRAEP